MSDPANETWTLSHDLALIYIALAYGTDYQLSDEELDSITEVVQAWQPERSTVAVQELVLEAMSIFLEGGDIEAILGRAVRRLGDQLSEDDRRRALENVVQVAEADGVLLSSEQSMIRLLADAWNLKVAGRQLIADSAVEVEEHNGWSLLHDIALVYVILAHSADNELSTSEIDVLLKRLGDWQPDLAEEEIREVVRRVLTYYGSEPGEQALQRTVEGLRDALPVMQRLAVLDDLVAIAEADGTLLHQEKIIIASLARAWNVDMRLNGTHRSGADAPA